MAGVALRANCNENDINELSRIINGNYNDAIKKRARIILLNSQGILNKDIAAQVKMTPRLIGDWVRRFNEKGIPGLFDQPKPGRKGYADSNSNLGDMIQAKLQEPAPDGYENWNAQCISEVLGVPVTTVWAECRARGIRPRDRRLRQSRSFLRKYTASWSSPSPRGRPTWPVTPD